MEAHTSVMQGLLWGKPTLVQSSHLKFLQSLDVPVHFMLIFNYYGRILSEVKGHQ